jgi:hypothetical protein
MIIVAGGPLADVPFPCRTLIFCSLDNTILITCCNLEKYTIPVYFEENVAAHVLYTIISWYGDT